MSDFTIRVKNKFKGEEKRGILVYDSSNDADHIIPGSKKGVRSKSKKFTLPFTNGEDPEHYLLISVIPRHGKLGPCKIDLPRTAKITFLPLRRQELTLAPTKKGAFLAIPGGFPVWQLKITRPPDDVYVGQPGDNVSVGEDGKTG